VQGMSAVQEIVNIYSEMRQRGINAKEALEKLRARIETLEKKDQGEIVRQVRLVENQLKSPAASLHVNGSSTGAAHAGSAVHDTPAPLDEADDEDTGVSPNTDVGTFKKLDNGAPAGTAHPVFSPTTPPTANATQTCPRCGTINTAAEIMCIKCGTFLQASKSSYETHRLGEKTTDSSYFSEESTLVFMVRDDNYSYRLRPQDNRHDMVVGRSSGASMKPDIDLQEHNAEALGVSRLHMSLRYEPRDHTVCVTDMNSANGTHLNGQRLHPREVRVLRHGDELRLGRLVMRVYFQHGTNAK